MARDGFFTGLDIGTSSIKVLVAEHVNGEMNVIGVSNAKSAGVKDGIIVDIEAASNQGFQSIQSMLGCLQIYYKSKQLKE